MVNTERHSRIYYGAFNYNILNIVVNTELKDIHANVFDDYNILNIVVNTERKAVSGNQSGDYNILNIVVNTEQ